MSRRKLLTAAATTPAGEWCYRPKWRNSAAHGQRNNGALVDPAGAGEAGRPGVRKSGLGKDGDGVRARCVDEVDPALLVDGHLADDVVDADDCPPIP